MKSNTLKCAISGLVLAASASLCNAQQAGLAGVITQINTLTSGLGLQNLPGATTLVQTGAATTSLIVETVLPLSNDVPLIGAVIGNAFPVVTQLSTLGLPALTGLPGDTSGLISLLSTDIASVLEIVLPGNYAFSQSLPGL